MRLNSLVTRCSLLALAALTATAAGAQPAEPELDLASIAGHKEQVLQVVEQQRAERLAAAVPVEMVSPFYAVTGRRTSELFVLNNTANPVEFDLAALNPAGEVLPLGTFEVEVTRHLRLLLDDLIEGSEDEFGRGSLRISFLGDDETLQAWTQLSVGSQVTEVGFADARGSHPSELLAFWDARLTQGAQPSFHLLNAGSEALTYTITTRSEAGTRSLRPRSLAPGQSRRFSPKEARGSLGITYTGALGSLRVAGLLAGPGHLTTLPVTSVEASRLTTDYEAIRVPWERQAGSAVLQLFNSASTPREATVEFFDPASGASLLRASETVDAGVVATLDIGPRLAKAVRSEDGGEVRVRISTAEPGLLVSGWSRLEKGTLDHAFFRHQEAHASGSYPMPPLASHETFLTLVNLGDEPSQVVAQFYWNGGTYAWGPVTIGANASYRVDVAKVASRKDADLLGRSLDPGFTEGFLKWSARGGSRKLVARTETRRRGTKDTIGFNCFGCCSEMPWGEVIPGGVEFFVGQSPTFNSCYNISTCNGVMGPYLTWPTSYTLPAAFSWNGRNISASSAAQEDVWFYGSEEGYLPGSICIERRFPVSGNGKPDTCKTLLKKSPTGTATWNPGATCVSQTSSGQCSQCQTCCQKIYAYNLCKKKSAAIATSERNACLGNCATDRC